MQPLVKGRYIARLATDPLDVARALSLRHLSFVTHRNLSHNLSDADTFDQHCQHILVEDTKSSTLVCCFRLMHFANRTPITTSYSAQFYNLSRLSAHLGAKAELGRFCIHPDWSDPDILRVAWGAMTTIVDSAGVEILFGCTSFDGVDPSKYQKAFALLNMRHLAPDQFRPGQISPNVYPFANRDPDIKCGLSEMAPLLRTYLMMGGWVSDHAVIDARLNTLHVFTGLEIAAIPPARARALRAIAAII